MTPSNDQAVYAVIYASKSTPDEKGSNETQLEEGRNRATELGRTVVAEYHEDDKSGWKGDRGPELEAALQKARELADKHGRDGDGNNRVELWVWKSERLARGSGRKNEARSLLEVFTLCRRAGVTLRSVHDDAYVQDEAMVGMASKMAEKYSADLSIAVQKGMHRRVVRDGKHSGQPKYGYALDKELGLKPIPAEVAIFNRMCDEIIQGKMVTDLVRKLVWENVPTKKGGKWSSGSVTAMLRSRVYLGEIKHNGEWLPGKHEAVISVERWEKVQQALDARSSGRGKGRGRPPKAKRHLFTNGLLRCGGCESAMVPRTNGGYESYSCDGRRKMGKDYCDTPTFRRVDIDESVYADFERRNLDQEAMRQQVAEAQHKELTEVRALLDGSELEAAKAEERIARLESDYLDGKLDADRYQRLAEKAEEMQAASTAQVEQYRARLKEVEGWTDLEDAEAEVEAMLREVKEAIAGGAESVEAVAAVRAALMRVFAGFELHAVGDGEFEIHPIKRLHYDVSDAALTDPERPNFWADPERVPLEIAENKRRKGFLSRHLFGPIRVGTGKEARTCKTTTTS